MGKNYIENSLKRFLKRKVKITLGFVVAFMITGTVGFAEDNIISIPEKANSIVNAEQIKNFIENSNEPTMNFIDNINGINEEIKKEYKENFDAGNKDSATQTLKDINNYSNITISSSAPGIKAQNISVYNFGIIDSDYENNNQSGMEVTTEGLSAYNYGIINGKYSYGQLVNTNNGNIFNYGIIKSGKKGSLQAIGREKTGEIYNYGILINEYNSSVQNIVTNGNGKLYNYGFISTNGTAQNLSNGGVNDSYAYNYGIIELNGNDSKALKVKQNNTGVNAGVILVNNTNKDIFEKSGEGKIYNRGIIISTEQNNELTDLGNGNNENYNQSIILGNDYNLRNNNKVINGNQISGNKEINAETFSSNSKDSLYINNESGYTLSGNLSNKTIGTVINDNNIKNKVFSIQEGKESMLDKTALIGYFLNGGDKNTLVEVNGSLILNNSLINAIGKNATAVYIGENGNLTLKGNNEIIGKIEGADGSGLNLVSSKSNGLNIGKGISNVSLSNEGNSTNVVLDSGNIKKLDLNFTEQENRENSIHLKEEVKVNEINASESSENIKLEFDNAETLLKDEIILGKGNDTLKITKSGYNEINVFDMKLKDVENLELGTGYWEISDNVSSNKKLNLSTEGKITVDMNNNNGTSKVSSSLENFDNGITFTSGTLHYQMGKEFKLTENSFKIEDGSEINSKAEVTLPIIFKEINENTYIVRSANEFGENNTSVYNALLDGVNQSEYIKDLFNSYTYDDQIMGLVARTENTGKAYYTAGTVVTKNITDSYLSAVEDFKERAGKGEWLAQGKFINSDTEFDGGSKVKGYDGDINSAVGMVEYGLTENTSYGVAFGGGDTEIDIDGGGKLDGDNYYLGFYTKHRTANGIDLTGNIGFIKSDLDSKLANTLNVDNHIINNDFVDGSADSTAFALSLKGKKDFYVTDSVKLQPVVGARMTLINQDKAENKKMGFEVKEQDVYVLEGILGANIAKEFALENGKLEFNTGIEYAFSTSSENRDARYELFGHEIELNDSKIDNNKGTTHVGVDYEHENGVGFNGKYEMMWSDKGDDSRITAGISYRF